MSIVVALGAFAIFVLMVIGLAARRLTGRMNDEHIDGWRRRDG